MTWYGNDGPPTQGQLNLTASPEAIDAMKAKPTERDRRFRDAGWWPSGGTVVRAVLALGAVLVALGWTLTLLNK